MNLAILFWFYKEVDICENRLQLLKKYNPNMKIFGLYGGTQKESEKYEHILGEYLDDFYIFDGTADVNWKWINGDLMILDWYDKRGKMLTWDSVVVVQWDMLVFDSLKSQFANLNKGEIYLSGLRSLDSSIEKRWHWTNTYSGERKNYLAFLEYVKKEYGYEDRPPMCCLFVLQVFPKVFFEKYLTVKDKEIGMLEYKVPMYAKIFGIPFFKKDMGIYWSMSQSVSNNAPLNAKAVEVSHGFIEKELHKKDGWRIFHPYFKMWN